jgi:hypothetical protein
MLGFRARTAGIRSGSLGHFPLEDHRKRLAGLPLAALSMFFGVAIMGAQEPAPPPKPGPEHEKRAFFVGRWFVLAPQAHTLSPVDIRSSSFFAFAASTARLRAWTPRALRMTPPLFPLETHPGPH